MNIIKAFIGGGSMYAYLALAGVAGYFYLDYKGAQKDAARYEQERNDALAAVRERDSTIKSLAIQSKRQVNSQKDQNDADKAIKSVTDSNHCSNSEPIIAGLNWVRERENGQAPNDNGESNVPVPERAQNPD